MNGNNKTKYLKYAIGEIFLVVVGILIALSINTWNEERKKDLAETTSLLGIKSELIQTLVELNDDIATLEYGYKATLDVYEYIMHKPIETDSMYHDFYGLITFNYFFPKTSVYETLKSGNLNNIQSDSLRMLITDVYETGYNRILYKENTRRNASKTIFPYFQKHFRSKIPNINEFEHKDYENYIAVPNNYNALINDAEFETLIVEAILGRINFVSDYERTITAVNSCINLIDEYLEN